MDAGDALLALEPLGEDIGAARSLGVLRSEDGGRSWARVALPGPGGGGARTLWAEGRWAAVTGVEPGNGLRGRSVVRTSHDGGRTWSAVELTDVAALGGAVVRTVRWHDRWVTLGSTGTSKDGFGVWRPTVWISQDGLRWQRQAGAFASAPRGLRGVDLALAGRWLLAYAADPDFEEPTVWRSTNGRRWERTSGTRLVPGGLITRRSPGRKDHGNPPSFPAADEISVDAGQTWERFPLPEVSVSETWEASVAARVDGTWWVSVSNQPNQEALASALYRRTSDRAWHEVVLAPLPYCRDPQQVWKRTDPPRLVDDTLLVISSCSLSSDTGDGPLRLDVFASNDRGSTWSRVRLPFAARTSSPGAIDTRADALDVSINRRSGTDRISTAVLILRPDR